MKFDVMVLPGDGIGPEVVEQGVKLLEAISKKSGHVFNFEQFIIGGAAIDSYGVALKPELNLSDCIHPNEKGTIIISKTLEEIILKNL